MEFFLNHEVNYTYKDSMDSEDEHRTDGDGGDNSESDVVETSAEVNNAINRK